MDDREIYAYQTPTDDEVNRHIPQLVTELLKRSDPFQDHSVIHIAGWSFGGILAYEAAQQLLNRTSQGNRVISLTMLDAGILYSVAVLNQLFKINKSIGLFDDRDLDALVPYFQEIGGEAGIVPKSYDFEAARSVLKLFVTHAHATFDYRCEPLDVDLQFLQAEKLWCEKRRAPSREWESLCRSVTLHCTPGNHLTMVHPPHVTQLAATFGEILRKAEENET